MALFKIFKGVAADLPPVDSSQDGWCYFTTDDGKFYIDYLDGDVLRRRAINGPGQNIEYIEGTQTPGTATASWTGVTKDPSLYDGKIILYKLPAASKSNATLKLTFTNPISDAASTAIPVYLNNENRVSTHYEKSSVFLMVYESANNRWRAHGQWNTTYAAISTSEAWTGTATNFRVMTAAGLKAIFANLGGSGLTLTHDATNGIQLNHTNAVTEKTAYGSTTTMANANGGKITVTDIIYDAQGHITDSQDREITLSQEDHRVRQINDTSTNVDYRLLLSNSADDTEEDEISRKNANLTYNPSASKLNVKNLNVDGDTTFIKSPTAPTPAADANDTQLATTAFVMNAFTANDAMVFKGVLNSNSNIPTTHYQGWTYRIGTAGTYAGKVCEVGDILICVTDGTSANNSHWVVIQNNIDGALYKTAALTFTGGKVLVSYGTGGAVKEGTTTTQEVVKTVSLSGGIAPTLGEAIAADDITDWNAGSMTTASVANGVLTFSIGAIPSLSYTTRSIPNITDVGSLPTISTTKQSVITDIS